MNQENMSQDRRDAMHWAEEWNIKRRNRRILTAIIAVVVVIAAIALINFVSAVMTRSTFSSEEEMKEAVQGRYATDYWEAIEIDGDNINLTYYTRSHYDFDYAEEYGYETYDDSVYEDKVVKWDYRRGVIKCDWMSDITVDRNGNLVYYKQTFTRTTDPAPTPIDPSELTFFKEITGGDDDSVLPDDADQFTNDEGLTDEEKEAQEAAKESLEETQGAADELLDGSDADEV